MWHSWERTEKCTRFWWGSLKEGEIFYVLGMDWKIILKRMLEIQSGRAGTGFVWLRIELSEHSNEI
jgi:hypothetical protein